VRTLRAVLERLKNAAPDLDALALINQPRNWGGLRNPFETLAHQPSPSEGYRLALEAPGEALLNRRLGPGTSKRLRTKENRLARLQGYRYVRANTPAEVERYLSAFFAQKAGHFAEQGIDNVFGRPEVEVFVREACLQGLAQGRPVIELHALDSDDEVLSVFGGVNDGHRFSSMFNSYTLSDQARQSPGLVLLTHLVADCADRGLATFDLGVGKAGYKSSLCDEVELLFDSYLPLKRRGRIVVAALSGLAHLKRMVKRSPALLELAYRVRRLFP
jgi:CelD/BcsL family acetyltransferase involved in cellulose biosynthesis